MFTQGAVQAAEETKEYRLEDAPPAEPEPEPEVALDEEEFEEEDLFEEDEAEYEEDEDEDEDEAEEEDDEDAEAPAEKAERPDRIAAMRARSVELGQKAKQAGSGLLGKVSEIRIPRREIDGQKVLAGAGIAMAALLIGFGAYLLGKGSGEDVDLARLRGEAAGRQAGAVAGATQGYADGFKKGRDVAFKKSYTASYRRNYIRAYEDAGMDAPKNKQIEVPDP